MRPELRVALVLALFAFAPTVGAFAQDVADCDEAASLLLEPELRSDQARASEAFEVISAERSRKFADLSAAFVGLGLNATVAASPIQLLRSVGKIGRGVRDWNDRTNAEDEALALLEPGARTGDLDAESLALYARLERRESSARVAELLADAERTLGAGDLRRTRRTIDRALALEPGSSRADRLLDSLEEQTWRAEADDEDAAEDPSAKGHIEAWEVRLGTALLVGDFERARSLGPDDAPDAALARATALHLDGEKAQALEEFRSIARGDDEAAARAREFLADPALNPEAAFDRELANFRTRRALGWLGGPELAETAVPPKRDALSFSRGGLRSWQDSLRAWRNVLRPANLIIEAPARAWRLWQPDAEELYVASERYLEIDPEGDRAAEAASWLEALGKEGRKLPRVASFSDGVLDLARSRTSWNRLSSTRIAVARAALEQAEPALLSVVGDDAAPAFLLVLDDAAVPAKDAATRLSTPASLRVLARLASGVERSTLAARGESRGGVLAVLRRLDSRVRQGQTLAVVAWAPAAVPEVDGLGMALVEGRRTQVIGAVEVERKDESLTAERNLQGSSTLCPPEWSCIDLQREIDPVFYASSDADGDVGVGARAEFESARLSFEVGTSGPRASLVIPFSRWLGIGRFFPVAARLAVGLDGISAGPQTDKRAGELPEPSL